MLKVNEIFYSIQGEGKNTGTPMNFIRLSGCNIHCKFCDTEHGSFSLMSEKHIFDVLNDLGPSKSVCITGGEPLLQDIRELVDLLKRERYRVFLETNGSMFRTVLNYTDWVAVSPKENTYNPRVLAIASEIKFIMDASHKQESEFIIQECMPHIGILTIPFLQPLAHGKEIIQKNVEYCIEYAKNHPGFRVGVQLHKLLEVR